jgi:hypothetical protein
LVRPSFVPPKPIRELRNLTRYRRAQIEERTREAQHLDKVLQDAGIKLSSVASHILACRAGRCSKHSLPAAATRTSSPSSPGGRCAKSIVGYFSVTHPKDRQLLPGTELTASRVSDGFPHYLR